MSLSHDVQRDPFALSEEDKARLVQKVFQVERKYDASAFVVGAAFLTFLGGVAFLIFMALVGKTAPDVATPRAERYLQKFNIDDARATGDQVEK